MEMKWLKHRINGVVQIYTDILAGHEDMIECDKDGNVLTLKPRIVERQKERYIVKDGMTVLDPDIKVERTIIKPGEDLSAMSLEERITICRDIDELALIATELSVGIPGNMSLKEAKQNIVDMLPAIREEREKAARKQIELRAKKRAEEEAAIKATKPKVVAAKSLREQIAECDTPEALNAIAIQYEVAFKPELDIEARKTVLVNYLKEQGVIETPKSKRPKAKKGKAV